MAPPTQIAEQLLTQYSLASCTRNADLITQSQQWYAYQYCSESFSHAVLVIAQKLFLGQAHQVQCGIWLLRLQQSEGELVCLRHLIVILLCLSSRCSAATGV